MNLLLAIESKAIITRRHDAPSSTVASRHWTIQPPCELPEDPFAEAEFDESADPRTGADAPVGKPQYDEDFADESDGETGDDLFGWIVERALTIPA